MHNSSYFGGSINLFIRFCKQSFLAFGIVGGVTLLCALGKAYSAETSASTAASSLWSSVEPCGANFQFTFNITPTAQISPVGSEIRYSGQPDGSLLIVGAQGLKGMQVKLPPEKCQLWKKLRWEKFVALTQQIESARAARDALKPATSAGNKTAQKGSTQNRNLAQNQLPDCLNVVALNLSQPPLAPVKPYCVGPFSRDEVTRSVVELYSTQEKLLIGNFLQQHPTRGRR
jgi:hypothetical protein